MSTQSVHVSFTGSYGTQFGHDIYTTSMPFKSLERFLTVFPEVQRKLNKSRVKDIAEYIQNGLDTLNSSFFSAITTTCRGEISYDESTAKVNVDINAKLSVNDGQHRLSGIRLAIDNLLKQINTTDDEEEKEQLKERLNILENMAIPVVIFDRMDSTEEEQLFHDLNYLAAKPPKSVSLKFDNNDLYNKLAKELAVENEWLLKLGVETNKTMLRGNEKIMVLSTLRNMISLLISGTSVDKTNSLTNETYQDLKQHVSDVLSLIFSSLPSDCTNRETYVIGNAAVLQGIGKYIHQIIKDNVSNWQSYVRGFQQIDWKHENRIWDGNGGRYDSEKSRIVFSGTHGAVKGVCETLIQYNKPLDETEERIG